MRTSREWLRNAGWSNAGWCVVFTQSITSPSTLCLQSVNTPSVLLIYVNSKNAEVEWKEKPREYLDLNVEIEFPNYLELDGSDHRLGCCLTSAMKNRVTNVILASGTHLQNLQTQKELYNGRAWRLEHEWAIHTWIDLTAGLFTLARCRWISATFRRLRKKPVADEAKAVVDWAQHQQNKTPTTMAAVHIFGSLLCLDISL